MKPHTPPGVALAGVITAALLLAPIPGAGQRASRFERQTVNGRDAVAREALVRFRQPGRIPFAEISAQADAAEVRAVGRAGAVLIRSRSLSASDLIERLSRRGDVVYAEPNFVIEILTTPNDPRYPELWGLDVIHAPAAWDLTVGSTANVVAVIDTGIDYTHPDLAANMWSAPSAFTVNLGGKPITCPAGSHGFNAITRTCDPMDDHHHGSHVAGTIGAVGGNGTGVAGVNWTAQLMGLKFVDAEGNGTMEDAIASFAFAAQAKQAFASTGGANVRVLSNSWGGPEFSQALLDEINAANGDDMLVVAGAGNNGFDNDILPFYPASYAAPNVISVAATTFGDGRAWFSNYGASSVHLAAPGDFILSTIPGGDYTYLSGTSMATPHVSGAAALVLAHCDLDTATLKETLLGTVDPLPGLTGITVSGGRLNVNSALRACTAPPEPPVLTAKAGDTRVTLSWPSVAGAMRYNVGRSLTSGGPYEELISGVRSTTYVDTAVQNGTTYYYVVSAANALGESGPSNEASATPSIPSDLIVSSFTVPSSGSADSTIAVSVTVRNQGTGSAQPSVTRFYLSANILLDASDQRLDGAQAVPQLAPGAAASASLSLQIPPGVATGTVFVIAQADADDVLGEASEANNAAFRAILIGPDLVVSALSVPAASAAGASISVSDTIKNQGGGGAGGSAVTFYLSANGTVGAGDVLLGSRSVPPLGAGVTSAGTTTLTIPSTTAVGAYNIVATADGGNDVPEASEINNVFARAIQIGGDLVVSALGAPSTGAPGGTLVVTDTIKNQGGGAVSASVTRFYLSANSLVDATDVLLAGARDVPPLDAGAISSGSTTVTVPAATTPGAYYIVGRADADNEVPETYETNNTSARFIQIGSDLVVSAMTVPAQAAAGATVSVSETTTNQGAGTAAPSTTRFYLSANAVFDSADVLLTSFRQVPELAPGTGNSGATPVTIPASTPSGTFYIIAKADGDGAVSETNEGNNTVARAVRIGGDLVVSALTVPAKGGAGMSLSLTDTTTNQGASAVGASATRFYFSVNVLWDAGDVLIGTRTVPALGAGAGSAGSTTVTLPSAIGTGTFFIIAKANADDGIVETQTGNNALARAIAIGSDLWVSALTAPAKAAAGSAIVLSDTTANQGGGGSPASTTRFYLSADGSLGAGDVLLEGSRQVPALLPGAASTASTAVTIPAGTAPGNVYIIAEADADDAVGETQEINNTRSRAIGIGPDLVVTTVGVSLATIPAGSSLQITETVANQGADAAPPSVNRFYLSKNGSVDGTDIPLEAVRNVPAIAAGGSSTGTTTATIPLSTPPGTYYLLIRADDGNAALESLETNNVLGRPVGVAAAP